MNVQQTYAQSHLFTVRLWLEEDSEGQTAWRGKLHCVPTNETRYFRDWSALIPLLLAMLRDIETKQLPPQEVVEHSEPPSK